MITTVGELRDLVAEQENKKLVLGEITIRLEDGDKDLEIHVFDNLVQWWNVDVDPTTELTNKNQYTVSSSERDVKENWRTATKRVEELEEAIKVAEAKAAESNLALGKVEAYEKMLLNRTVSIGA